MLRRPKPLGEALNSGDREGWSPEIAMLDSLADQNQSTSAQVTPPETVVTHGAYPPAAATPTQQGPLEIRYDFNSGARVALPPGRNWRVRLRDLDTGNTLFESRNEGAIVSSAKRFFVRFGIDVWEGESSVFTHDFDARGREVLIQFPIGTLGDILAWFPYAERFAEKHGANVTCALSAVLKELLAPAYPKLRLVDHDEVKAEKIAERAYATYSIGLFFDDAANVWQPTDFRHTGLHRTAAYILGVEPEEIAPRLALADTSRPIAEPYVCIAVQSSTQCKYWNNPEGWHQVIAFLKERGFRVLCIDQKRVGGSGVSWNHIPHGAEDFTGDIPLAERARTLKHAAAFIGLSSGLAWLAWATGAPVVMISGFTHPTNEFHTPYRVINWHTCNSCWNDVRVRFDHHDFMWCPRHAGTPQQFECTRLITGVHVIETIKRIPAIAGAG
jgi:autotransporter strand-loop-strand O-heptosyltransferase